jgi:hypothetical protein
VRPRLDGEIAVVSDHLTLLGNKRRHDRGYRQRIVALRVGLTKLGNVQTEVFVLLQQASTGGGDVFVGIGR